MKIFGRLACSESGPNAALRFLQAVHKTCSRVPVVVMMVLFSAVLFPGARGDGPGPKRNVPEVEVEEPEKKEEGVHKSSSAESYSYGMHLFRYGNYSWAAYELDRFVYYHSGDPLAPCAIFYSALAWAGMERYDVALSKLSAVGERTLGRRNPPAGGYKQLGCSSLFAQLNILFRQKKFIDFYTKTEELLIECPDLDRGTVEYVEYMKAAAAIYNMEWKKALEYVEQWEDHGDNSGTEGNIAGFLEKELSEAVNHNYKKPVIGGILSIVPGLGHFYAGRAADGLRSLAINTAFITLAAYCLKNKSYILGGVFGAVEGLLYVANIYGGVNAVLQENARYRINKRELMLRMIPVPPLNTVTFRGDICF
ncbi:MAG: hypothetical protein ACOC7U_09790 [Spirochaetota bacterium]